MSRSVKALYELKSFKLALGLPIFISVALGIYIYCTSSINLDLGYIGVNYLWSMFHVPIAIFALIIPSVALVASNHRSEQSKKQIELALEQNKLSVRPVICSWIHTGKNFLHYEIVNKGLGPAKIDSFSYFINGQKTTQEKLEKDLEMFLCNESKYQRNIASLAPNAFLAKDEKFTAIHIIFEQAVEADILIRLQERYSLLIHYQSMYGQKDIYDSNSFKH